MTPAQIEENVKRGINFVAFRKTARQLVSDLESSEGYVLGKREGTENFPTLRDFELKKNKVVKVSDVIAAANLIAAHFMVRVWPEFLKTKIEEFAVSKIASALAKSAAVKLTMKTAAKGVSGWVGAFFGALAGSATQQGEMQKLEREIRRSATVWRRELNANALSQAKKPVRMGKVSTRNG